MSHRPSSSEAHLQRHFLRSQCGEPGRFSSPQEAGARPLRLPGCRRAALERRENDADVALVPKVVPRNAPNPPPSGHERCVISAIYNMTPVG